MRTKLVWMVLIVGLGVCYGQTGELAEVSPAVRALRAEVRVQWPKRLAELDSPQFAVRQAAGQKVQAWLANKDLHPVLAELFQQTLLDPATSFEVRSCVQRWNRGLPAVATPAIAGVTDEDLDRLVGQLDDDSFSVRAGAKQQLRQYLKTPSLAVALMPRLKRLVLDPNTPPETRQEFEPHWQQARGAWLLSDPAQWDLPPVSEEQIRNWIATLAQPVPPGQYDWPPHIQAEGELLDLLARDGYVPIVTRLLQAIQATVGRGPEADRLQGVLDWTKPAMVAEYWEGRRHRGEQHLLVGVPSLAEQATRPSHFDRIDDEQAHCVSGATLSPGTYPAMAAFPHPRTESALEAFLHPRAESAFFHLMNLPTPRRRMAYPYYAKQPESQRLQEISRRTLSRWLSGKKEITLRDAIMLFQLDRSEVSRFAGRYFDLLPDGPLKEEIQGVPPAPVPTRHALLCSVLMRVGTQEAMAGLLTAIEKKRFLPPSLSPFYHLHWCAALAITRRDPWPGGDPWLAGLIGRTDSLQAEMPDSAELGATAAALLLSRHGRDPASMGLLSTNMLIGGEASQVLGHRFASDEDRQKIRAWWKEQKSQ